VSYSNSLIDSAVATTFSKWRLIRTFEGHEDIVNSVAFSPDGKHIVSGAMNQRALKYDFTAPESAWNSLYGNNTLKLWETESGRLVRTFEGQKSRGDSVAFSPNGKYIVSGSGKTLELWGL